VYDFNLLNGSQVGEMVNGSGTTIGAFCNSAACLGEIGRMAFLKDLSDHTYANSVFGNRGTKAIGWLAQGYDFPTAVPKEEDLDLLWQYCSISVAHMRGGHDCEFCPTGSARRAERNGERRLLGTAEIRVFSPVGWIYAAPNLIYHYVAVHHYRPPDEFLQALREGPRPPSQDFFNALSEAELEWNSTSKGPPSNRVFLHPQADPNSKNYLNQLGTLQEIRFMGLQLMEGMVVSFYQRDTESHHNENYLLFEGTVHFDSEKAQWYAVIDQESCWHEFPSSDQPLGSPGEFWGKPGSR
jgi:hypothetical protein